MKLSQSRTFLPESYYNALHGRFEGVIRDVRRDNNQAREKIGVITDHERQARMQARYDEERRTILHVQSQEWYQKAQDSEEIIRQLQSSLQILGSDIQHLELNISIANSALA